jgi:hypothetical protein
MVHDPGADTVAGKLAGNEEPGGTGADDENVLHDTDFLLPDARLLSSFIQRKPANRIEEQIAQRTRTRCGFRLSWARGRLIIEPLGAARECHGHTVLVAIET